MSRDLWKLAIQWRDQRPDGNIRHSQLVSTFGPGALADFVDEAAIVAGLGWWAKGLPIVEDRLLAMLAREPDFRNLKLFAPPPSENKELDDPTRKWIKGFLFPEWFVCRNERCWEESGESPRRDGAKPRRLLHVSRLSDHKCRIARGKKKFQPIRFTRACRLGHIDDIDWPVLVHRKKDFECKRVILWVDEAGASGDLADVRVTCSGCGANIRMTVAAQRWSTEEPTLGWCAGRRPWLGEERGRGCTEEMRLLLRSASHAYFPVTASVIHIPDPDAALREKVAKVYDTIKEAEDAEEVKFFRKKVAAVRVELEGITDDAVFAEVARLREGNPIAHKKVKEAEIEVLQKVPEALATDRPGGRFYARTLTLPKKRSAVMAPIERVVLVHRLTEVRALAGFTRFEPKTVDVDGELDIGAEVARPDDPLTWLPAVENHGEGFFLSLREPALAEWEKKQEAVRTRDQLFKKGFALWQAQRDDRKKAKADFANARFVLLHSLSHLLITAVSLECGYSASSIRERIYSGAGGCGILLYTASSGAEGSLGGLVEVGRRLERYLTLALDLGRLCSNDPVCATHAPPNEVGTSDRYLEGASCHGCLLISEPSCERMNVYLDRTLVVPTVAATDAAFFRSW
jgi:hypothetical protein